MTYFRATRQDNIIFQTFFFRSQSLGHIVYTSSNQLLDIEISFEVINPKYLKWIFKIIYTIGFHILTQSII